ncbi:hypothetical protein ACNISL_25645, partial [Escherichia coli]
VKKKKKINPHKIKTRKNQKITQARSIGELIRAKNLKNQTPKQKNQNQKCSYHPYRVQITKPPVIHPHELENFITIAQLIIK